MEFYPTLRPDGQITVPKDIREELGLSPGDRIRVTVEEMDDDE